MNYKNQVFMTTIQLIKTTAMLAAKRRAVAADAYGDRKVCGAKSRQRGVELVGIHELIEESILGSKAMGMFVSQLRFPKQHVNKEEGSVHLEFHWPLSHVFHAFARPPSSIKSKALKSFT